MPDDQARPTDEILRETIYDWLGREFKNVEHQLDAAGRVDLDGVLWKLSGTLTDAGMWKALQDTVGVEQLDTMNTVVKTLYNPEQK